jgi:hypothetical protein
MSYWKNVNPVGAIADFRTVFQQAGRNRWRIAVLAAAATITLFSLMTPEDQWIEPRSPQVTYITSWHADRSDAEIVASNLENEKNQAALRAEQAKREAEVREMYRTIGRASGMDVEAIERKAAAERAATAKTPAQAQDQVAQ